MKKSAILVTGEDTESDDDEQEELFVKSSYRKHRADGDGDNSSSASVSGSVSASVSSVVISGEAPESDNEDLLGSTVSLASTPAPSPTTIGSNIPTILPSKVQQAPTILTPAEKLRLLNPTLYKAHTDRLKSLRSQLSSKWLQPIINQNSKKMDKLSQNLSNTQVSLQDSLLQSRMSTANMLRLQKEIENLMDKEYMKEIKPQMEMDL